MNAERDHLTRVVFPELAERMASRRLHLRPIDLRWGVLPGEDSVEICLAVLERCRPFLVGVLGGRYGFIPPGANRSITAMEITRGVLEDPGQRMISRFYFRDPAVHGQIPPDVRPVYVDPDPEAQAGLKRLRERLLDAGLEPRTYGCRWDVERGALVDLDGFGQAVLEDLWQAIDAEYPETMEPQDVLEAEREAMDAFIVARSQRFRGRERPQRDLRRGVEARLRGEDSPGLLCVVGEPGSGKSSMLGHFSGNYPGDHPGHGVLTHFVGASPSSTDVEDVLERLWGEVARHAGLREEPPADLQEAAAAFPDLLGRAAAVHPICIVIDALDQLEVARDAQAMWWLPETVPPRVCFVTSANEGRALDALRRRREPAKEIQLARLTSTEAREIVQGYLDEHFRKLTDAQWSALLRKGATGNPLYLLVALEELRLTGRFDDLERQIGSLPDDVSDLFGQVLERLEAEHGTDLVGDFSALVAVGRGGQAEEDLRAMVTPGEPVRDMAWERLFRSVGFYLLRRSEFVDFFHRQLREAAVERYLGAGRERTYHRRFAEHLRSRGFGYPRTLNELPHQLRRADMDEELFGVVQDPAFRTAKLTLTRSASRVAADVGLALEAAFERDDLGRAGGLGFLHADLAEGRFGKRDVLELHRHDPGAALEELRLFRERPRFRLLVLLALREAELGRISTATELVEAATRLRGVILPEGDAAFLAQAATRLLGAGCRDGPRLLLHGARLSSAARAVVDAAGTADPAVISTLLEAVARALGRRPQGEASTEDIPPFELLAAAAARLEDRGSSSVALGALEESAATITPLLDVAVEQDDQLLAGIAVALTAMQGGGGQGVPEAAHGHVGAGYVRAGEEDRGHELLARVVAGVGARFINPDALAALTRALLAAGSPRAATLLGRLAAGPARAAGDLRTILGALAADRRVTPRFVEKMVPSIDALPPKQSAQLIGDLAIAYGRSGEVAAAHRHGSTVTLNRAVFWLIARNPLLARTQRVALGRQQVRLATLAGVRGRAWARGWLERLARWAGRIPLEPPRAAQLKQLVATAGEVQVPEGFPAVLDAAGTLTDQALAADVLEAALGAAEKLDEEDRKRVRARVLDDVTRLSADVPRSRVRLAWVRTARPVELGGVAQLADAAEDVAEPAARAEILGAAAGALVAMDPAAAGRIWQRAADAEQESAAGARVFVAHASAAARSPDPDKWQQVKRSIDCPDPEVAAWAVEAAADACSSSNRLGTLEGWATGIPWTVASREHLIPMHLSLARAWARLGEPGRAARLLARLLGRGRAGSLSPDHLSQLASIGADLVGTASGRALLLRLIPQAFHAPPGEVGSFEDLAIVFAQLPRPWARTAYRQLLMAALDRDDISKWTAAECLAGIAVGLARAGSPRAARATLDGIQVPGETASAEEGLLQPTARAAALLRLGRASAEVGLALREASYIQRSEGLLGQALMAAASVTDQMHRPQAVRLQVETWLALRRLELPNAEGAREEAEKRALDIAREGSVSPAVGLSALARAYADIGEVDRALSLARQIRNDEASGALLTELVAVGGAGDLNIATRSWSRVPSAEGRRRAAWRIARARSLPEELPEAAGRPAAEVGWTPRIGRLTRVGRVLAAVLVFVVFPAITYWFGVRWIGGAIEGLGGPQRLWWGVGLTAVVLALWAICVRAMRTTIRRRGPRILVGLLLVPLAPLVVPAYLYLEPYHHRRTEIRARFSSFVRRPLGRGGRKHRTPPPRGMPSGTESHRLLRMAAAEAEPFDLLLSTVLASGNEADAAAALATLPDVRLPTEPPERAREALRQWEQLRRERKLLVRAAGAVRSFVGGLVRGFGRVVLVIVVVPVTLVSSTWRARRRRRAMASGKQGSNLLSEGRAQEGSELLRRATKGAPDIPQFWHDYAVALAQLGKTDAAVDAHREATARGGGSSDEPQFWYGMGFTLFGAGRWEEALAVFERTLEVADPGSLEHAEARSGKEYCLQNLGREA